MEFWPTEDETVASEKRKAECEHVFEPIGDPTKYPRWRCIKCNKKEKRPLLKSYHLNEEITTQGGA